MKTAGGCHWRLHVKTAEDNAAWTETAAGQARRSFTSGVYDIILVMSHCAVDVLTECDATNATALHSTTIISHISNLN